MLDITRHGLETQLFPRHAPDFPTPRVSPASATPFPRHVSLVRAGGPRIKSERGRGGLVDGIVYRHIVARDVETAFSLTLNYASGIPPTNATATPRLRNVLLENITFIGAHSAGELNGLAESPIANVTLRDVRYVASGAAGMKVAGPVDGPPKFGKCEHVEGGTCEGSTNVCPPCFARV